MGVELVELLASLRRSIAEVGVGTSRVKRGFARNLIAKNRGFDKLRLFLLRLLCSPLNVLVLKAARA